MEHEATALRAEVDSKSEDLESLRQQHQRDATSLQQQHQRDLAEIAELKAELENNAGGFGEDRADSCHRSSILPMHNDAGAWWEDMSGHSSTTPF